MGQRICRAKAKTRDAGIGFAIPGRAIWPARLPSVLTAVYLIFTRGYAAGPQAGQALCEVALFLARLLVQLCPDDAEIEGALALILITPARAGARGQGGAFQIKAAVAACHVADAGPDWRQIAALLGTLLQFEDTPVVRLSLAVALGEVQGAAQGLTMLHNLAQDLADYGPYHAARANMLARLGQTGAAHDAFARAMDLAETEGDRAYLALRLTALP